jgi:hypothetical protein
MQPVRGSWLIEHTEYVTSAQTLLQLDSGFCLEICGSRRSFYQRAFYISSSEVSVSYKEKVKCTLVQALRLCTGHMAHRGSRGIALPFLDHGTRRGWGVSVTPRPLFTPRKDSVPIVQEAGWAPGLVWIGAENPASHRDPRTIQPVASCYTDYGTRPTICFIVFKKSSNSLTKSERHSSDSVLGSSFKWMHVYHLRVYHICFLPYPFIFIILLMICHSVLYIVSDWQCW